MPFQYDEATPGYKSFQDLLNKTKKSSGSSSLFGDTSIEEVMALGKAFRPSPEEQQAVISAIGEQRLKEAKQAQELGKESAREAFKYEMLGRLPDTIMAGAIGPQLIASEGARGIANSMMVAGQQIPDLVTYQRSNFGYTPTRYFQ